MARDRNLLVGTAAAVVAAALFGTLGPLSRFGADAGVDGVAFTAWRALLGATALSVLVVLRGGAGSSVRAVAGLTRGGRIGLLVAATMGLTLNASIFTAFGRIPIALALMLFYTYPAGVALVDVLLGREQVTRLRVLALALSLGGVALVLLGGQAATDGAPLDALGILLGLAAAGSQVVFVTISRTSYRAVPADAATLIILTASAVGASAIAVAVGQLDGLVAPLRAVDAWPALLFSGVAAAGLSSLLFLTSIRRIGGTRTGILMLLEPVVGVFLAAAWLGEALGPVQALGAGLVLAGGIVLQLTSPPGLDALEEEAAGPIV